VEASDCVKPSSDQPFVERWIVTPAETADELAALLSEAFDAPAATHLDPETGRCRISLYLPAERPLPPEREAGLRKLLAALRQAGILPRTAILRRRVLPPEAWADSWKRHFPARVFGGAILVRPSWSTKRPRPGQAEIVLDPGMSFGTGQHPTTAFCLEELARLCRGLGPCSVLDVGTGSGILAIAAAKLGCRPIRAFDHDPEAVRIARENAAANGVAEQIRFATADLRRMRPVQRGREAIICANLLAGILERAAATLASRLRPGGRLLAAGILEEQFPAVQAKFESLGLLLEHEKSEGEWRSGTFRRPAV